MRFARSLPLFALCSGLAACAAAAPPEPCPPAQAAPAPSASAVASAVPAPPVQAFADAAADPVFIDPARRKKLETSFPAIEGLALAELQRQKAPSFAVGVVIDGELAYARGFGVADAQQGTKADADTVYRIGSITKSMTALTVLSLRDDGVLALDDTLVKWLPSAAGLVYPTHDTAPITLRQLLTHTSGLPRIGAWDLHNGPSEEDVTKTLAGFALEAVPGARYTYSNLGFALLGLAASHAAKSSLHDLVDKRLFKPLGMTSTVWERADLPAGRVATAYERDPKGEPKATIPVRLGAAEASGGIYSSVRDMARYVAFQLAAYPPRNSPDSGPVRRSSVREAHATGFRSNLSVQLQDAPARGAPLVRASTTSYGMGWVQEQTCELDDVVRHGGMIDGFTADLRFLTTRGVGVVTLANYGGADPGQLSDKILQAMYQSGGLAKRSAPLSPALDLAMKKLLALYAKWDDAAYAAMLSAGRPKEETERAEIAGYRALHGECKGYSPIDLDAATHGRFKLDCERGSFEMDLRISASDGGITGFAGRSLDIEVTKSLRAVAEHLAGLIGKWDERVYKTHLAAKNARPRQETVTFFEKLRSGHGGCTVKSATHDVFDKWFELDCERGGGLVLDFSLDKKDENVVQRYAFRPSGRGVCPVR